MSEPCLLIGDIGGTNARFALVRPGEAGFSHELTLSCDDYETAERGFADYLDRIGGIVPDAICLAAAGPVIDDRVRFSNNHWIIDGRELRKRFPLAGVRLLNDFEAIACSIPLLGERDTSVVGLVPSTFDQKSDFTIGVMGPGTGLGIGGLLGRSDVFHPIFGEGSHCGFAPETRTQLRVLEQLRQRFDRVSEERLVSGPGLENIYWALCKINDQKCDEIPASEIFSRVLANEDVIAAESVQLFFEVLGQIAGNLALTLNAYDGIYLAGGIVKRYPELLDSSNFRAGFENKGRHRSLMEGVPVSLIQHPQPGLLGASYCVRQLYQQTVV